MKKQIRANKKAFSFDPTANTAIARVDKENKKKKEFEVVTKRHSKEGVNSG